MIGSELGYAGSEHVANSNVANSTSSETGVNRTVASCGGLKSSTQHICLVARMHLGECWALDLCCR